MKKGYLFLIGGAEDRKGDKQVLQHLVNSTRPATIVIIPTASGYPLDVYRDYADAFRDLGVQDVECLDIRYRDETDRIENIEVIDKADLIYFGGGDQVKLVDVINGTRLFDRMRARFESGEMHIAGTSAGAAAAGNPILYKGDRRGFKKGSIKFSEGFGFVDGVAIDTHFSARKRLSRLCQLLVSGHCRKGIGLDEDTGIMIDANLHLTVIGRGMVTIVNSTHVSGSNYRAISNGEKLRFNNMHVGFLPAGTRFSIRKWSILSRSSRS